MYRSSKAQVVTRSYTERLNWICPNRGGIIPSICPGYSLVHYNNGRSNGKHKESSTLDDDVRVRPGAVCYDAWGSGGRHRNMESCVWAAWAEDQQNKDSIFPTPKRNDTQTTVKIVDELPTVTSFKYLGSPFPNERGSQADINIRIIIGWMKWKEVFGVMCGRKILAGLNDKVLQNIHQTSYDIRFWMLGRKRRKMRTNSIRPKWEKTRLDHIRNEDIRKEAHVKPVVTFLESKILKWFATAGRAGGENTTT